MAQCISCKVSVGCGCQLTKGYCSSCWLKIQQDRQKTEEQKKLESFDKKVSTFLQSK